MLIHLPGEELYSLAEGTISPESSDKADLDSVYCMASLSKLMTTVGVMICVERGQISLDDDVADVLPDLCAFPVLGGVDSDGQYRTKTRTKPITLRLLMSHRSRCGYDESPGLPRRARQNGVTCNTFDSYFVSFHLFSTYQANHQTIGRHEDLPTPLRARRGLDGPAWTGRASSWHASTTPHSRTSFAPTSGNPSV